MKVMFTKAVGGRFFSFRKNDVVTVGERHLDKDTAEGFLASGTCTKVVEKKEPAAPAKAKAASKTTRKPKSKTDADE